jgi:hypothetical protein
LMAVGLSSPLPKPKSSFILFYFLFLVFFAFLHPKSSIGLVTANRESDSLSVYLLYTSDLKPE